MILQTTPFPLALAGGGVSRIIAGARCPGGWLALGHLTAAWLSFILELSLSSGLGASHVSASGN
jgi:hypothetical protein